MKFQRCSIPPAILFLAASLLFIVLFSMLAPVLFPIDLGQTNLLNRLLPPSFMPGGQPQFLLGTDHLGRDFAIRLVYATRNTLLISFSGMLIASLIGTTLGVIGGLYRGWADTMVMFLIDARLSVPFIVIAIVCSSIFGSDKVMMVLIIGFAGWASFARLIRGQIIQLREANFIECSRAIGASRFRDAHRACKNNGRVCPDKEIDAEGRLFHDICAHDNDNPIDRVPAQRALKLFRDVYKIRNFCLIPVQAAEGFDRDAHRIIERVKGLYIIGNIDNCAFPFFIDEARNRTAQKQNAHMARRVRFCKFF